MKRILLILMISVTILCMSCDEPEKANPFIGTWESTVNSAHYIITNTNFTCQLVNNDIYYTGTYTYNDTHITITVNVDEFPLIGNEELLIFFV